MGTSKPRMMASRHFIAEALGGISLVGVLTFAAQWGTLTQMVKDQVDPEKHAMIVVAGSVETGEKINEIDTEVAVIKSTVEDVKEDIAAAKTEREAVKADVAETKGDVKVNQELLRRLLDLQGGSPP